jgi:aromatic-L-amino-acid/L-tryptophan decarboxylase
MNGSWSSEYGSWERLGANWRKIRQYNYMHHGRSISLDSPNSSKERNGRISVTENNESATLSASLVACPLVLSDEQFSALGTEVLKFLSEHLSRLPHKPIRPNHPTNILPVSLLGAPPENGSSLSDLLEVVRSATQTCYNQTRGGFMAYVPGGGLVTAAMADLMAGVINPYTGFSTVAPDMVALEVEILDWFASLVGLPSTAFGILTSGGSLSILSAFLCARTAHLPQDFRMGTVYASDQTHFSTEKALRMLGFPPDALRVIPCDPQLRMDLGVLKETMANDRAAGRKPFCIVANAGTTNTGVIDPLPAMAEIAQQENLWFHIDAAYGGFFQLTERGRERLVGIEQADSVVLDPHKGLFLPFGTGCLLVRDRDVLRQAHAIGRQHLLQDLNETQYPDFADLSPELTRPFRGLRLWLALHLHGVAAFRKALDEKLDLAQVAYQAILATPNLEAVGSPDLSIFAFRYLVPGGSSQDHDQATLKLVEQVNATGHTYLSSTQIRKQVFARIAVLGLRTDAEQVAAAIKAIREFGH